MTPAKQSTSSEQESRQVAEQARQTEWEGKGFLRDLFLGKLQLGIVYPFPLNQEERPEFVTFYQAIEQFLRTQVDSAAIDETGEYPPHVLTGLRKLGAFGMKISKEYGGVGLSVVMATSSNVPSSRFRRPSGNRSCPCRSSLRRPTSHQPSCRRSTYRRATN